MNHILAIDQSTSGTKAILFNQKGELVHRCTEGHHQYYPKEGWVEHNALEIYEKTLLAVKQVLIESKIDLASIRGLAITNQRETAVVWDKTTGLPVYNAVVWQCLRGDSYCRKLKQQGLDEIVQKKTGLIIDPYFSASGVQWILDNVDGARAKAENGELLMGTIDSWLIWKFTNGRVHATDYTNASRTLLFNLQSLSWDPDMLNLFTIPQSMMATVKPGDAIFGETTIDSILPAPVPICGVMGDSHAALFGQNCFEPGMAKATYGTGSSIMMNIGEQVLIPPKGLVTSVGYAFRGKVNYVFEGNIHCTGDTIKWLVDNLQLLENSVESETLAASVLDNGGVYFVPAFAGLGAPYWNSHARALITGMSRGTSKAHIVRAAVESIAFQITDLLSLMQTSSGIGLKELRVDGGPTRNKFLMQFQVDMLNAKVNRSQIEEASALGVSFLAMLGLGFYQTFEDLKLLRKQETIFTPNMDHENRNILYSGWQAAIKQTLFNA